MLCRVLLGLDRAGASGTLHLRGEGRTATLSLDAAADALVTDSADAEKETSGYRLSEHVAAYYKSQTR